MLLRSVGVSRTVGVAECRLVRQASYPSLAAAQAVAFHGECPTVESANKANTNADCSQKFGF